MAAKAKKVNDPREEAVGTMLDSWHASAARGDLKEYLSHMYIDSVFIGTDSKEYWGFKKFAPYCHKCFKEGKNWKITPLERSVYITYNSGGDAAYFYERLRHKKYGELRGSGTAQRAFGTWRIAHYVLSFAVPNDFVDELVEHMKKTSK